MPTDFQTTHHPPGNACRRAWLRADACGRFVERRTLSKRGCGARGHIDKGLASFGDTCGGRTVLRWRRPIALQWRAAFCLLASQPSYRLRPSARRSRWREEAWALPFRLGDTVATVVALRSSMLGPIRSPRGCGHAQKPRRNLRLPCPAKPRGATPYARNSQINLALGSEGLGVLR